MSRHIWAFGEIENGLQTSKPSFPRNELLAEAYRVVTSQLSLSLFPSDVQAHGNSARVVEWIILTYGGRSKSTSCAAQGDEKHVLLKIESWGFEREGSVHLGVWPARGMWNWMLAVALRNLGKGT